MIKKVINKLLQNKILSIFLAAVVVLSCGYGIRHYHLPKVKDLTVELGTETVSLKDFATEHANPKKIAFVSDPSVVDLNRIGSTEITLSYGRKQETVILTVVDTVAPQVEFVDHLALGIDQTPDADDFVSDIVDESATRVFFTSDVFIPKDYADVNVTVVVEDAAGNQTSHDCLLTYNWIEESCTLEYGDKLTKEDILLDPVRDASLIDQKEIDQINVSGLGEYTVTSQIGNRSEVCRVTVADTKGPEITVRNIKGNRGTWLNKNNFVESVKDVSGVAEVRVIADVDTFVYGQHTVIVEAEDIHGNISRKEAYIWIANEHIPPVISGATSELSVEKGGNLDLLENVTAYDKKDGVCEVVCDAGKLDLQKAGTYYVTYRAWDTSGNEAKVKRKVTVEHDAEDTAALAASFAAKLSDNPERIRDFVRTYISYNHDWGDNDPVWYGFTNRVGNCYVHALCLKSIFDLKGIENQLIWVNNKTHYWLIVKIDGVWKHIDPTPSTLHGKYSLMNDKQRLSTLSGRKWDTSLWPACE